MNSSRSIEIHCSACGQDSFLLRRPRYEGLRKIGDSLHCAGCGHEYPDEAAVPFKEAAAAPAVFDAADRSAAPRVFSEHETRRLCRHCAQYTVNPFMQWCARHKREVEATDTCDAFTPHSDDGGESPPKVL